MQNEHSTSFYCSDIMMLERNTSVGPFPPQVQVVPPEAGISPYSRFVIRHPNCPKINEIMCMSEVPWKATFEYFHADATECPHIH